MPLIASVSGVRGTVPDALTGEVIARFVDAFSGLLGDGPVVVGRDGRPSGVMIEEAVNAQLVALGRDVISIGVVPTPTVQMEILRTHAAGGISISASHNPAEWNGLKFLEASSMFLGPLAAAELVRRAGTSSNTSPTPTRGSVRIAPDAIDAHIAAVLASPMIDIDRIRQRAFHVVVDAVNAAGSVAVPRLLEALGCRVTRLYCDGSGMFPHTPEPLPQNLGDLCAAVSNERADIGLAVDPDSDRLVVISDRGEPIGEEYTIVECVQSVLRSRPGTPVVVNLSTTRAVEDVAAAFGSTVIRTPVGEINVALAMQDCGAVIGGEGSGGVILAPLHLGRDALAGCALTLHNLVVTGLSCSAMRDGLPTYAMIKHRIALSSPAGASALLRDVAARFPEAAIRTDDGVHARLPTGDWVHARSSNTEPIVRIIAEAKNAVAAEALVQRALGTPAIG